MILISNKFVDEKLLADILSVSRRTIRSWIENGKVINSPKHNLINLEENTHIPIVKELLETSWEEENKIKPLKAYKSIELFAGAGGMAIGLESAGFSAVALNEIDKQACATLKHNRPNWNVLEDDINNVDFSNFKNIDLLSGGFPCQAFSHAGNKLGFEDTRGTLFFEMARAIKETQPKIFLAENVKGLLNHDKGRTLSTIKSIIQDELGYHLIEPKTLKALFHRVPQKRERLIIIGIRNDLKKHAALFKWPSPYKEVLTVRDALKKGKLYSTNVPDSEGQKYPKRKSEIMALVPEGGFWVDLPEDIKKEYMKASYYMGGGKTGMARRLAWNLPSLTLTCAPAQKQTERCHPSENRPLTIREYARIQTFPDSWSFSGSVSSQYKQIGNAVPINLALDIGKSLIALLNRIEKQDNLSLQKNHPAPSSLFN